MIELWSGAVPLAQAFWRCALLYGTLANLVGLGAALAVLVLDGPAALAVAVYVLPLAYVAVAVVGVFRSARRYAGPKERADLARVAVAAWALLMVFV